MVNRLLCVSDILAYNEPSHASLPSSFLPSTSLSLSFTLWRNLDIPSAHQRGESNAARSTRCHRQRAKVKLLTFVRLVDFIQAVVTEAGVNPPGAQNRQGERTRYVARRFELPAVVAYVCEEIVSS